MSDLRYFYADESEQFAFYRMPKILFTDPYYKKLSCEAKVLYGLFIDRMQLSRKNHWVDAHGHLYIIYTVDQIREAINCSKDKAYKMLAELDQKGVGLIERVKQGQGRPDLIYVKNFVVYRNGIPAEDEQPGDSWENNDFSESGKNGFLIPENPETENQNTEKTDSRILKKRIPESVKTDPIKTNIIKTDMSDTEILSIYPEDSKYPDGQDDGMDVIDLQREMVEDQIEYSSLMETQDRKLVNEITDVITEMIAFPRKTVVISDVEYKWPYVRDKFKKLGYFEVEYVLDCLRRRLNQKDIGNIKNYMIACLFNAPSTMATHYQQQVNSHYFGGAPPEG